MLKNFTGARIYFRMGSFFYSFLAHMALAAAFLGSGAVVSSEQDPYQVEVVSKVTNPPIQPPKSSATPKKHVVVAAATPKEEDAPAEQADQVINLHQSGISSDEVFSYLVSQIYKNRIYPYDSIRLKQQGQVTLSFYINESGHVTDIAVVQPCGHKQLNHAAVKTLEGLHLNREFPKIETLFKRRYSFTFDFELIKPT